MQRHHCVCVCACMLTVLLATSISLVSREDGLRATRDEQWFAFTITPYSHTRPSLIWASGGFDGPNVLHACAQEKLGVSLNSVYQTPLHFSNPDTKTNGVWRTRGWRSHHTPYVHERNERILRG